VGPIDWPTAFWQPEASAWLAQHYYDHYLFSRDEAFLKKRAWPVMKAAAEFWLDALVTDPRDGKLVVSPSYSPEHGPFTAGASMSQQIVADLFVNASEAARRGRWHSPNVMPRPSRSSIVALRIGSWASCRSGGGSRMIPRQITATCPISSPGTPAGRSIPIRIPSWRSGRRRRARRCQDRLEPRVEDQLWRACATATAPQAVGGCCATARAEPLTRTRRSSRTGTPARRPA
jgi:alpha-L-fucosidase 2